MELEPDDGKVLTSQCIHPCTAMLIFVPPKNSAVPDAPDAILTMSHNNASAFDILSPELRLLHHQDVHDCQEDG